MLHNAIYFSFFFSFYSKSLNLIKLLNKTFLSDSLKKGGTHLNIMYGTKMNTNYLRKDSPLIAKFPQTVIKSKENIFK